MKEKIANWLVGKLDVDGNGKVRWSDFVTKVGPVAARLLLVGIAVGAPIGYVFAKLVK